MNNRLQAVDLVTTVGAYVTEKTGAPFRLSPIAAALPITASMFRSFQEKRITARGKTVK